jgi:hypothetical protein
MSANVLAAGDVSNTLLKTCAPSEKERGGTRLLLSPLAALARLRRPLPLVCNGSTWRSMAHNEQQETRRLPGGTFGRVIISLAAAAAAAAEGVTWTSQWALTGSYGCFADVTEGD